MNKIKLDKLNDTLPTLYLSENGELYVEDVGLYYIDTIYYEYIVDTLVVDNSLYILSENEAGKGYVLTSYTYRFDKIPYKVYIGSNTVFLPNPNISKYKLFKRDSKIMFGEMLVLDTSNLITYPKTIKKIYEYDIVYESVPETINKYDKVSKSHYSIIGVKHSHIYLVELYKDK